MIEQQNNRYHAFKPIVAWTLIGLTFTIIPYLGGVSDGRKLGDSSIAVSSLVRFCYWAALFPLIFLITKKFGFQTKRHYMRNVLIHLVLGIVFSIVFFIAHLKLALLDPGFQNRYPGLLQYVQESFLGVLSLGLSFYALLVVAVQAYLSYLHHNAEEKRTAQLQSELVQSQLHALKMQLQPHFLFNTLNSISSLVLTDPRVAYSMIAKLGDFLRLTLDYNEDQMVLLNQELQFLRSYLEIEQMRFSDRLQIKYDIEDGLQSAVVPHLILQPIVENSIKHAIGTRTTKGVVEIKASKVRDDLYLQVIDNGPGFEADKESVREGAKLGYGLLNVRSRLDHIYGNLSSFEMRNIKSGGTIVLITIPLNLENGGSREVE